MATDTLPDLLDPVVNHDPYSFYARLRAEDPLHWDEKYAFWLITRYDDVVEIARHPERFSNESFRRDTRPASPPISATDLPYYELVKDIRSHDMLQHDPPEHGRQRDAIHPSLAPKQVERWRGKVRTIIEALLDSVAPRGRMELMREFATPLPLNVISEMLGIPPADRLRLRELAHRRLAYTRSTSRDRMRLAAEGIQALIEYLNPLLDRRKVDPQDDLLSIISMAEREGIYSRKEALANAMALIDAGHETTINLICNGVLAFLRHPDEWDRLRRDPALAAKATEECLRYDGPVKTIGRIAACDVELRGKRIHAGDRLRLVLAAANRDPAVFPDPDRFDITRRPNHHVAFGTGIHYCLGQYLARLEGQEVFTALVQRFPDLRLEPQEIAYEPSLNFRILKSLWVAWG
jgi:cytochrome P450